MSGYEAIILAIIIAAGVTGGLVVFHIFIEDTLEIWKRKYLRWRRKKDGHLGQF